MQRCSQTRYRGAKMQRWFKGAVVQRCRRAQVQRCRCRVAEVVQRWCRGADMEQRFKGAERGSSEVVIPYRAGAEVALLDGNGTS